MLPPLSGTCALRSPSLTHFFFLVTSLSPGDSEFANLWCRESDHFFLRSRMEERKELLEAVN